MERSFARAVRYGFKRAKWRGLWRVRIQEYITAAIQEIQILIKHGAAPKNAVSVARKQDRLDRYRAQIVHKTRNLLVDTFSKLKLKNQELCLVIQVY